jgi:hypothetical protein
MFGFLRLAFAEDFFTVLIMEFEHKIHGWNDVGRSLPLPQTHVLGSTSTWEFGQGAHPARQPDSVCAMVIQLKFVFSPPIVKFPQNHQIMKPTQWVKFP